MKKLLIISTVITLALLLSACSNKDTPADKQSTSDEIITNIPEDDTMKEDNPTEEAANPSVTAEPVPTEIIAEEKGKEVSMSDAIPSEYLTMRDDNYGSIEPISYQTHDYFGDSSEITKNAYVYLPYNYDTSKQYNVLYLMHGIGGNEKEWGMFQDSSKVKIMMDNLIYNGDIEPFIIVVPNGRSSVNFADSSSDYGSFYVFGQELRNDLIPYIESTYSTYAEYDEKGYDLSAARDHRAMAGLSMGGMQTINIGICESLDIMSYFGAFSAAPTSYTSDKIATILKDYADYDIHNFYNICGTEDGVALSSASSAVSNLTTLTDKLIDGENFKYQEVSGGHDFNIWFLGFYNFAQMAFSNNTYK